MKRFALLRLEWGRNKVIKDCYALNLFDAVEKLKNHVINITLDVHGYAKFGDVSFCVAEYWEPFHTV
jgi:hypothetical protein